MWGGRQPGQDVGHSSWACALCMGAWGKPSECHMRAFLLTYPFALPHVPGLVSVHFWCLAPLPPPAPKPCLLPTLAPCLLEAVNLGHTPPTSVRSPSMNAHLSTESDTRELRPRLQTQLFLPGNKKGQSCLFQHLPEAASIPCLQLTSLQCLIATLQSLSCF